MPDNLFWVLIKLYLTCPLNLKASLQWSKCNLTFSSSWLSPERLLTLHKTLLCWYLLLTSVSMNFNIGMWDQTTCLLKNTIFFFKEWHNCANWMTFTKREIRWDNTSPAKFKKVLLYRDSIHGNVFQNIKNEKMLLVL